MQDKIKEAMIAARPLNQKVIDLAMENRDNEATEALLRESAPAIQKCQDLLDQYSNRENPRNKQDAESASKAYETARGLVLFMSAIAIVLGAAAATLITHGLLRSSAGSQAMRQRSPQVSRPATSR
jgi:methyl-accepting chemotaxis protein